MEIIRNVSRDLFISVWSTVWLHLDIKAAFLHIGRLVEEFEAVIVQCQLFPLLAAGNAGGGVLWNLIDFSSHSDLIIRIR